MSQRDLNEMVSRATGESLSMVDHLGFQLADSLDVNYDPEPRRPLVFDWDSMSAAQWPQ